MASSSSHPSHTQSSSLATEDSAPSSELSRLSLKALGVISLQEFQLSVFVDSASRNPQPYFILADLVKLKIVGINFWRTKVAALFDKELHVEANLIGDHPQGLAPRGHKNLRAFPCSIENITMIMGLINIKQKAHLVCNILFKLLSKDPTLVKFCLLDDQVHVIGLRSVTLRKTSPAASGPIALPATSTSSRFQPPIPPLDSVTKRPHLQALGVIHLGSFQLSLFVAINSSDRQPFFIPSDLAKLKLTGLSFWRNRLKGLFETGVCVKVDLVGEHPQALVERDQTNLRALPCTIENVKKIISVTKPRSKIHTLCQSLLESLLEDPTLAQNSVTNAKPTSSSSLARKLIASSATSGSQTSSSSSSSSTSHHTPVATSSATLSISSSSSSAMRVLIATHLPLGSLAAGPSLGMPSIDSRPKSSVRKRSQDEGLSSNTGELARAEDKAITSEVAAETPQVTTRQAKRSRREIARTDEPTTNTDNSIALLTPAIARADASELAHLIGQNASAPSAAYVPSVRVSDSTSIVSRNSLHRSHGLFSSLSSAVASASPAVYPSAFTPSAVLAPDTALPALTSHAAASSSSSTHTLGTASSDVMRYEYNNQQLLLTQYQINLIESFSNIQLQNPTEPHMQTMLIYGALVSLILSISASDSHKSAIEDLARQLMPMYMKACQIVPQRYHALHFRPVAGVAAPREEDLIHDVAPRR